jgi:magnesium transporter
MTENLIFSLQNGQTGLITEEEFSKNGASVCYLTLEQLHSHHSSLGLDEAMLRDLSFEKGRFRSSLDVFADISVGYINIINVDELDGEMDRVMFIFRKDLLCLVKIDDRDNSESDLFREIMSQEKQNTSLEKIFYRFLERLLKGGNSKLESIEKELLALEDRVVHGRASEKFNKVIYGYRRQLSLIRNYYEQLVDISSELEENENEIHEERSLSYFRVLTAKAERLIAGVRALSESLSQLREMLDAALNYNLNTIMKVFTMITAVFLPLTLIVGWYGMNFKHMPELEWRFAYPLLAVFCVILVAAILYFFKKKKLM